MTLVRLSAPHRASQAGNRRARPANAVFDTRGGTRGGTRPSSPEEVWNNVRSWSQSGSLGNIPYAPAQEPDIDLVLTWRASEVLGLLGRGLWNMEIASALCLSVATIKRHVHHILEKLKLERQAQAHAPSSMLSWNTRQ